MGPEVCKVGPVPLGQGEFGSSRCPWPMLESNTNPISHCVTGPGLFEYECHLDQACEGNGLAFHTDRIRVFFIHSGCAPAC